MVVAKKKKSIIRKVNWYEKYSVDIQEIDDCQKKIFNLFNELIDKKRSNADIKEITSMISTITDCAKSYFLIEEKHMKKGGYPDCDAHAKNHRRCFIKELKNFRRKVADDDKYFTNDAIKELRDWLINHILRDDSLFVPFLRINSYLKEVNNDCERGNLLNR